jgi:hypothetical protein
MIIPISSHLIPMIQEALAIAYQTIEDNETREAIADCMFQIECAEMNTDGTGSTRIVSGEKGEWRTH